MLSQTIGTRLHMVQFDSLYEMTEEVAKTGSRHINEYNLSHNSSFVGRSFSSYQNLSNALNQYWKDGMQTYGNMIDKLRQQHIQPPQSIRRRAVWDEDGGDELCLDRLRSCQPYWRTTKRNHRPGPLNVTVFHEISTSAAVSAPEIIWRGAAATCLTELLESSGYRVELWTGTYCKNGLGTGRDYLGALCLKRTSDPLDASTLINATSSWSYRTLFFASYNCSGYQFSNGGGNITSVKQVLSHITPDEQTIVIPSRPASQGIYGGWNEEAAVQWIKDTLTKFNYSDSHRYQQ